jgi:quinol monooxygenase YgiN
METELKRLLRPVRGEAGCVSYNMYKKQKPVQFLFEEKWASLDALKTHMQGDAVQKILHNDYFKALMADEQVNGPWSQIEPANVPLKDWTPCPDPLGKAVCGRDDEQVNAWAMTVDKPLDDLWAKIGNIKDSTWVMGTHSLVLRPKGRIMYFGEPGNYSKWLDEDISVDDTKHQVVYKIADSNTGLPHVPGTYEATLTLKQNIDPTKTDFTYVTKYVPKPEFGGDAATSFVKKDMGERFEKIKKLEWLKFPKTVVLDKKP